MRKYHLLLSLLLLAVWTPRLGAEETEIPGIGLVKPWKKIKDDIKSAGPLAADPQGNVYFADNAAKKIYLLNAQGDSSEFFELGEKCSGLAFDPRGRIIACLPEMKQVVAINVETKKKKILAAKADGKELQQPQDVVVDSAGGVYFSDPPAKTVYYISSDGKVHSVVGNLSSPGALLLSPNAGTLYVQLVKSPLVMEYALNTDLPGTLDEKKGKGKVFCTLKPTKEGEIENGLELTADRKGNLFILTSTRIQVFDPKGKNLGMVPLPELSEAAQKSVSDVVFGGNKKSTLFLTAGSSLYAAETYEPFDPYPLILLGLGILCIFVMIIKLRLNAFLALIIAALIVGFLSPRMLLATTATGGLPLLDLVRVPLEVGKAFGELMGKIGLPIAFATIIGKAMMDSGAADRIVRFFTDLFGQRFAPLALLASGFILSIPVFFDNVFLLLVPLARAMYVRTGKNYLLYVTAIGAGGAVTHSLVPPTPGPIVMSEILNVDLGFTIMMGILIGTPLALVGFSYATFANKQWPVTMRETASTSLAELEERSRLETSQLPSLAVSFLPILLPVLFITSRTVFDPLAKANPDLNAGFTIGDMLVKPAALLEFVGQPAIALLVSALVSMLIVARHKRLTRSQMGKFTALALDDAGMILLITSAGGAFAAMLENVGVGDTLKTLSDKGDISTLVLAWGLAVLFKIAQGSGTVAMITSARITFGILKAKLEEHAPGQAITADLMAQYLGYHPVYLVMAIGCGSKIASWMNDSGFWVVSRMGGLTELETFKSWTMALIVMGLCGLPLVLLLSWLLPLV